MSRFLVALGAVAIFVLLLEAAEVIIFLTEAREIYRKGLPEIPKDEPGVEAKAAGVQGDLFKGAEYEY